MEAKIFWKYYTIFQKDFNYIPKTTSPKLVILWPHTKSSELGQYLSVLWLYSWYDMIWYELDE